ncbi:MAG: PQQ-binding-like beta-propeller repeat protein [Planctomycetes bacterium]|nr:PQQ-binding-like beta-propeller repeat protein [Planctomycetota bacterium]
MPVCRLLALSAALLLTTLSAPTLHAEDWPTYRHDVSRSGISTEKLPVPLTRVWTYRTAFAPLPAFGTGFPHVTNWEGGVEKRRIDFDRADSVIAAGGNIYFGSVGDGRVYCLDPATGKIRWTFPTGGPVRVPRRPGRLARHWPRAIDLALAGSHWRAGGPGRGLFWRRHFSD